MTPMSCSSDAAENDGTTTDTETGLGVFLLTAGRNTTGAVAARLITQPGANGRAVLFNTELAGSSGRGVGGGTITVSAEGTEGLVCGNTEGAGTIVLKVSLLTITGTAEMALGVLICVMFCVSAGGTS